MIFDETVLFAYGATSQTYAPNELIFREADSPKYYFQILDGIVELNNYHLDGKEFTQNILSAGQSIGESFLFGEKSYPMNAYAKTECSILKLSKRKFLKLLNQNPDLTIKLYECLSDRLYNKYLMLFNLSSQDPVFKLRTLMDHLKGNNSRTNDYSFQVPLTRKQLANLTALRIETVVRTIKKMEKDNILKISNGKILY